MPLGKAAPIKANEFREEPFSIDDEFILETGIVVREPATDLGPVFLKVKFKVPIGPRNITRLLMKLGYVKVSVGSGAQPSNQATSASTLAQALSGQSTEPVMFEYQPDGSVGNIFAPSNVSRSDLNLHVGIISMFNVKIKNKQAVYNQQEFSAGGICNTQYEVPQQEGDELVVTKTVEFNNCQDKASKNVGKGFMDYCEPCQWLQRNIHNTAKSTITLKDHAFQKVVSEQTIFYSSKPGQNGTPIIEVRQVLTRDEPGSSQSNSKPPQNPFQDLGNLQIVYDESLFAFQNTENLKAQVEQTIQHMVQTKQEKIQKYVKVSKLLHYAPVKILSTIWAQFSQLPKHRFWLLQGLRLAGSEDSLKFAKQIFQEGEVTEKEAAELIPVAMHATQGSEQALQTCKELIEDPKVQKSQTLYKLTILSYGSMINKLCRHRPTCPKSALQPLYDLAAAAHTEQHISLALKALGNAGRGECIPHIKNFLPGLSSNAAQLSVKNKIDAVMALRNVAKQNQPEVKEILMQVCMDRNVHTDVRTVALLALFETKPEPAVITKIAKTAADESKVNPQFSSCVFSHIKALAKRLLQLDPLAIACDAGLKLFDASFAKLANRFSTVFEMKTSKYPRLSGAVIKVYVMKNPTSPFPAFVLGKLQANIGNTVVDIAEISVRTEQTSQGPLNSVSVKLFNQEVSCIDTNNPSIQEMIQGLNEPTECDDAIKNITDKLFSGLIGQFASAVENVESRHTTPTILGVPVEISMKTTDVGNDPASNLNVDFQLTPPDSPDFYFAQLMDSQIEEHIPSTQTSNGDDEDE